VAWSTFGDSNLPSSAQVMHSTVALEVHLHQATISTRSVQQDSAPISHSTSNMGALKLEQSSLVVIGYGPLSGCSPRTTSTVTGQHQEKLIFWSHVAMMSTIQLVESIPSDLLFIGEPTGIRTNLKKLIVSTLIPLRLILTSTPTVFSGMQLASILILTMRVTRSCKSTSLLRASFREANSLHPLITPGLVRTTQLHSTENST